MRPLHICYDVVGGLLLVSVHAQLRYENSLQPTLYNEIAGKYVHKGIIHCLGVLLFSNCTASLESLPPSWTDGALVSCQCLTSSNLVRRLSPVQVEMGTSFPGTL